MLGNINNISMDPTSPSFLKVVIAIFWQLKTYLFRGAAEGHGSRQITGAEGYRNSLRFVTYAPHVPTTTAVHHWKLTDG